MFKTHKVFELYRKIAIVDIREIKKKKIHVQPLRKLYEKQKRKIAFSIEKKTLFLKIVIISNNTM